MIVTSIIVIGIVLGAGIILLDQFGDAASTTVRVTNETVTVSATGTAQTAQDELTAVYFFGNQTNSTHDANWAFNEQINVSLELGLISVDQTLIEAGPYNITYDYLLETAATTATDTVRNATDDFATWIPVIVIILSTAIILGLLTRSFRA